MKTTNKIDVHHHIFPKEYLDALKSVGVDQTFGHDFPKWTVETSFKNMKKTGAKIAMQSISTPGVYFPGVDVPEGFAEKMSRITNEIMAENKKKYPDRFGGFATIPILNLESALNELAYALDELNLDGVCLMTNYGNTYLGDESLKPFFEELNRRKAVVYIHPNDPGLDFDPGLDIPNALIEAPFQTTRAVANMLHKGTLTDYPDIKYILSHGGGTIPYIGWRLASIVYGQKDKRTPLIRTFYDFLANGEPTWGLKILKNMYYDTAHVSGTSQVTKLQEFAGPDQIVFGTDLNISKLAPIITKNLEKDREFTDEEYDKMSYGNCLKLFPSYSKYFN